MNTFKLAVVQAAPVVLDRAAALEKAAAYIARAAREGAKLVVFPEAYVPTYPFWVWFLAPREHARLAELHARLVEQSVSLPGPELAPVQEAARAAGVFVALGVNERNAEASGTSLFNTVVLMGPDGEIVAKHRKLVPTGPERLVWAQGDGSTLSPVSTPLGRFGMLICWENYMPLARYALYAQGMDVLLSPTYDEGETALCSVRHIAKEGRVYVASASLVLHVDHVPKAHGLAGLVAGRDWIKNGDSAVAAPSGELIAGPLPREEGILYADIDPVAITGSRWNLDVAGHYARPDVFHFGLRRRMLTPMSIEEEAEQETVVRRPSQNAVQILD
ncbi:MAG: carbon-nitrogen hydrolase family protein [Polaromonas sp.]|uniref:carbon-nitrogen hydrolase family protein n=1 Tax=Polaromonas sp. TaxID=1869339 RepID=UPI00248A20C7|nr:carbon-nitrogen hydrolase family protein [Polaromonas sp.]MDI1270293.1 carbon-nitrogen hydrolase family protein [Polaromonas sp.]